MSEPRISTGSTRTGTCVRCGRADVEQTEHVGLYGSGPGWSTEPHRAPCGLWCFGGGTRGGREGIALYREGRMHGLVGYPPGRYPASQAGPAEDYPGMPDRPCPACTGLQPVSTSEARAAGGNGG